MEGAPETDFSRSYTVEGAVEGTAAIATATSTAATATTDIESGASGRTAVPIETAAAVGERDGWMSKAAVVGVAVGSTVAVMVIGAIGWFLGRQWQRRSRYAEDAGEKLLVKPQR